MQVPIGDYVSVMTLNFTRADGLHFVLLHTKKGETISAGLADNDSEMETLVFDSIYRLLGFKSIKDGNRLVALGAIMFDSGCNVLFPYGPRIES